MFLSAILSVLGLGLLCWALFTLAVYALPFFVAASAGLYLYEAEAGLLAAVAAAFFAGAATLLAGQIAFATIRSVPIRLAIGALYALPAGVAGFHAIKGPVGVRRRGRELDPRLRRHRRSRRRRHGLGAGGGARRTGRWRRSVRHPPSSPVAPPATAEPQVQPSPSRRRRGWRRSKHGRSGSRMSARRG